ncbi:MAG: dihydrofolate reductase family protein [Chloroflexota bacterium]
MRKVVLYMTITVDGFLAGANGELDWGVALEDEQAIDTGLIDQVDMALIGHGVYKDMADYWTSAVENPSTPKREAEFAEKFNAIRKLVFSTTAEQLEWNNTKQILVKGKDDIAQAVTALKKQPGKDMVLYGGVRIAQTFVQLGLIDEYQLVVHPVILGSGQPLFKDIEDRINLKLVSTKHDKSGVVLLCYQPEKK